LPYIYSAKFNTGTNYGDGTDENVLVRLYGFNEKIAGDYFCDYANKDDFEARGTRHIYNLKVDEYIGEIERVLVYVRPFTSNFENCAWYLSSVEVKSTVDQQTYTQTFKCERWIGIPERCPERPEVYRFVECYPEGPKEYNTDPDGGRALSYPIRSVEGGSTYQCFNDPNWEKEKRTIINASGGIDDYCEKWERP